MVVTRGACRAVGAISATTGTICASGTVTKLDAKVRLWYPATPFITTPILAPMIDPEDYSPYSGTWTGTYEMSDGIDYPLSIVVDSSGYLTCTITQGALAGVSYGRITNSDKKASFALLAPLPGWNFDGEVDDTSDPVQASGTVVSRELTNHEIGTWSVVKQ